MLTLIPLADGHMLSQEVVRGLGMQSRVSGVLCISRPREDGEWLPRARGWKSMSECRAILAKKALETDGTLFLLLNGDIVLEHNLAVNNMTIAIWENKHWGGVAINTRKKQRPHIDIACMVVQRQLLEAVRWENKNGGCNCMDVANAATDLHMGLKYL